MNVYVDIRSLKLYMKNIIFFNSFNYEACHFGFMIAFKWHFVFKASNDMKIRVPRLQTVVCAVDTSVRDLKIIKVLGGNYVYYDQGFEWTFVNYTIYSKKYINRIILNSYIKDILISFLP